MELPFIGQPKPRKIIDVTKLHQLNTEQLHDMERSLRTYIPLLEKTVSGIKAQIATINRHFRENKMQPFELREKQEQAKRLRELEDQLHIAERKVEIIHREVISHQHKRAGNKQLGGPKKRFAHVRG